MAQIIDITKKITNELPMVKITDELVVTVNNRKNTIMSLQAMVEEEERKSKEAGTFNELDMIRKSMVVLVGAKAADEVESLNLPLPEYKTVYQAVMAAATGASMEEVASRFQ